MNDTNVKPTVTITAEEHERLLEAELWLSALEAAGVDNWDGYEEAIGIYQEMEE